MKSAPRLPRVPSGVRRIVAGAERRVAAVLNGSLHGDRSREKTWLMIVRESDMLFLSWPMPVTLVRAVVPAPLEIDTCNDTAWVTVEALHIDTVRFRTLPRPPKPIKGVEVNVRTYVRYRSERGVYFLSLDGPGAIVNALNRRLFNLPFHTADVRLTLNGDNYHVESLRLDRGRRAVAFAGSGRITGSPQSVAPASIEEFLLTQTTLFGIDGRGRLFRGEVAHRPRVIQPVEGIVEANTLVAAAGLTLPPTPPLIQFSAGDDSLAWPFERVETD